MYDQFFECARKPYPVFGSSVSPSSFGVVDIEKILHFINTAEEFVTVLKLKDGRFASVFCKKHADFFLDDVMINESVAHVADSYESIIKLGLTNSTRDVLGI